MDRFAVKGAGRWYRRLQVQLWLWAILPLTLVLVALTFTGVYSHQLAMRDFVAERDLAMASLYGHRIDDALADGRVVADGSGLALIVGDGHLGHHGTLYILDQRGRVLYHSDPRYLGADLGADATVRQVLAVPSGALNGRSSSGAATLVSFASVSRTGWRVVLEEQVTDVIVPILRFSSVLPILVVAAGLLSVIVIYFSLQTVVRPLQSLADEAARINGGDVQGGLLAEVGGVEEIRQLHRALRDMVERIRRYQTSMRDYIEGITQGQEAERARLSRELHDETVQALVAIGQRLQLTERALERGDVAPAVASLHDTRALCEQTMGGLRRTIRALRPVYLEDLGFLPALEALVREADGQGVQATIEVLGEAVRLRQEVELAAYRVAQEALTNALHHAAAQHIALQVHFYERELRLTIQDDGRGFVPPDAPDTLTQTGHLGLVGMRERTLAAGGRLELDSHPGGGTAVTARFPI